MYVFKIYLCELNYEKYECNFSELLDPARRKLKFLCSYIGQRRCYFSVISLLPQNKTKSQKTTSKTRQFFTTLIKCKFLESIYRHWITFSLAKKSRNNSDFLDAMLVRFYVLWAVSLHPFPITNPSCEMFLIA